MKRGNIALSILVCMLMAGCSSKKSVMVIAHRGASGYETENTLAAVRKAVELKSDAFEVDVWRTKDDSLVVFHDNNTKRLTGDSLVISQSSFAQLRELNLPGGHKIPTIREVLDIMPKNIKIVIEIKNCWEKGKAGDLFPELARCLKETETFEQAILISFNIEKLKDARKYLPEVPGLWLSYKKQPVDEIVKIALEAEVDGIDVSYNLISDELVEATRAHDFDLYVWTVNDVQQAKVLSEKYHVDGITTNFPDKVAVALGK